MLAHLANPPPIIVVSEIRYTPHCSVIALSEVFRTVRLLLYQLYSALYNYCLDATFVLVNYCIALSKIQYSALVNLVATEIFRTDNLLFYLKISELFAIRLFAR
jgi:hypothetical protein